LAGVTLMTEKNSMTVGFGNNYSLGTVRSLDDQAPILTAEEQEIIEYFVQGHRNSVSTQNLRLENTETSIRLSDLHGKLIGISKQVHQQQRKILISKNSPYRSIITQALTELNFIEKQKSSHPDFAEYHSYTIPDGYKLNYTEVIQLWKVWWNNKRFQLNSSKPPVDILIFSKGNWYSIQDLQPKQGKFSIRTDRGIMTIEPEEYVIWIDSKLSVIDQPVASVPPSGLLNHHTPENSSFRKSHSKETSSTAAITDASTPKQSVKNSDLETEVDLENYLNTFNTEDVDLETYLSTFNTEDAEDIDQIEGIYNIGELLSATSTIDDVVPHPRSIALSTSLDITDNLAIQRQTALKLKAMEVLKIYLHKGDRIVHAEVLKNAQGQEVNRKVTKIQRGCPSWAIDQIRQFT
jgi:hypothetical protein